MEWYVIGILTLLILINTISTIVAWIELKAMQKSTHTIQYQPIDVDGMKRDDKGFEELTSEVEDKLTKEVFDNVV